MGQTLNNQLQVGTVLNEKYRVVKVLGDGGFGITYLVWDLNMKVQAAIKEYFPIHLVSRDTAYNNAVSLLDRKEFDNYKSSLQDFVNEAATLARFNELPGIVSVRDFFYENNTGYIVMEYIDGCTLKEYLRNNCGKLDYKTVLEIMEPVIRSLHVIHKNQLLHRDIAPDNIMIDSNNRVKLIDFGASRYYGENFDDKSRVIMLKEGYAPIEQYSKTGSQGGYIDVYSICATMYRMITGIIPPNAPSRVNNDTLTPIRDIVKKVPSNVASAIESGLSVNCSNRTQNMQQLYAQLYGADKSNSNNEESSIAKGIGKVLTIIFLILVGGTFVFTGLFFLKAKIDDMGFIEEVTSFISPEPKYRYTEIGNSDSKSKEKQKSKIEKELVDEDESDSIEDSKEVSEVTQKINSKEEIVKESITKPVDSVVDEDSATGYNPITKEFSDKATIDEAMRYVTVAKDGKVLNHDAMTLGEILNTYSDTYGTWTSFVDGGNQPYTYYEGERGGVSFVLEFRIDGNSFTLTNGTHNGVAVSSVSAFFKEILDTVGV